MNPAPVTDASDCRYSPGRIDGTVSKQVEKKPQQYIAAVQEGKSVIINKTSSNTSTSSDNINQFHDQSKQNEDNEPSTDDSVVQKLSSDEPSTIDDSIPTTSGPEPSAPNEYNPQGSAFPNVQKEIGQADKIQKHKEDKIINTSTQTATDVQTDPS
ncbi:MAG: hypothetical protein WAM14_05825, partial [Candidatus Nitrosopolaris sp.]